MLNGSYSINGSDSKTESNSQRQSFYANDSNTVENTFH